MKLNYKWPSQVAVMDFDDWLHWIFMLNNINKEEVAITIWAIWHARNKFVHEKQNQSVETVVTFIRGFGQEFRKASVPLQHPQPRSIVHWEPPSGHWVKINVDASFSVSTNKAASGFVVRNNEGQIMGSGYKNHHLISSVVRAEAMAGLDGLHFAIDLGFTHVVLETDSKIVVRNILGLDRDYSEMRAITWKINHLRRSFRDSRVEFIAREGNGTAHGLATLGMANQTDAFWVEDGPPILMKLVDLDNRFRYPP